MNFNSFFNTLTRSLNNCPDLHLKDFRIGNAKAASPVSEHWVCLFKPFNTAPYLFIRNTYLICKMPLLTLCMRHKFMQRRVYEPNRHRLCIHCLKYTFKILSLEWKKFCKRNFSCFKVIRNYHLLYGKTALVCVKEHMFCPAKTYAFCAKPYGIFSVIWRVNICPDM